MDFYNIHTKDLQIYKCRVKQKLENHTAYPILPQILCNCFNALGHLLQSDHHLH